MDTDISDILASVSRPAVPSRALDLQALTRAWVNERSSPELLPYPTDLIDRCTDGVKQQIEVIESITGSLDPSANFTLVVIQTELERFKFLLRSFLRARLAKIDTFPLHYRALTTTDPTTTPSQPLLSPLETQYLTTHQALLAAHYHSSFLSLFPATLQKLDDTGGGISMVDAPDPDAAVFCRVLRDCWTARGAVGGEDRVELARGDVWVLRWSAVGKRVRAGDVELV